MPTVAEKVIDGFDFPIWYGAWVRFRHHAADLYGHLYDDDLDQVPDRLGEVRERFLRSSFGLPADQG